MKVRVSEKLLMIKDNILNRCQYHEYSKCGRTISLPKFQI